ncbi:hypothetical protein CDL15_Pgr027368 [Punica granatum]|uniref:Uncharacterized protein n=1 Tax=Punica granatum TaxID=22663 RepID=A0A218Y242_PUNGR|nr:hypothetical protein CDL15_Pgr027368 [Punica granatum]
MGVGIETSSAGIERTQNYGFSQLYSQEYSTLLFYSRVDWGPLDNFPLEVAVRPLIFGWKKHSRAQFVTSCINPINGSKGGRSSPRKISASGRTAKGAKIKQQQESSKGKRDDAADQEEIISLFRRIQSSIAKGESEDPKKKRSSSSRGDKPAAESVLEIIRSSRKQTRDKGSLKGGSKLIPRQRGLPRREKGVEVEDIQSIENFRLTRPPSNFVKRSPIPFPSAPRGKDRLLISEVSPAVSETIASQLEKLEEMKLPELKELAKSRESPVPFPSAPRGKDCSLTSDQWSGEGRRLVAPIPPLRSLASFVGVGDLSGGVGAAKDASDLSGGIGVADWRP